jgi:hypothetical protein
LSNRIDFFQSEQTQLALPASSVSVLVDGVLCPALEPTEIVRAGWPEFSRAKLAYNPAAYTDKSVVTVEDVETLFAMGKTVCIRRYFNGVHPAAAAFSIPIFCGQIEGIDIKLGSEGESAEVTARDFSANLERITVYGQRLSEANAASLFLAGLDTAFNPDGKANANAEPTVVSGKSYTTFCAEPSKGKLWSYAEVIDYLLCEYLTIGQLHTPNIEQLRTLTDNQLVRDLDVTGLNLTEALRRCCERIGLSFTFVPRPVSTGPAQAIVFYKGGTGRVVELNCQQVGEQLSISKTNISSLHSKRNFWPVTHKYIGQGDFKVVEATFDLIKAWDSGLEDINYDKFSSSTNPEFYLVKDVYRKWCLNEAGDYSGAPYNQGDAFDFSKVFAGDNFAHRRRRFRPTLTADKQGKSLGYFLQVSFDGGSNWWQYLHAFNVLLDECGVWLSSDCLDVDTWVAALKGVLKFRITASVVSDERLTCKVSDGPVNSTVPVVEHIITLPRQFKYRRVSDESIFACSNSNALGVADQVDNTNALYEYIRHRAAARSEPIEAVDISTPFLALDYEVGDSVSTTPESRDLLACRSDNRSSIRIAWVQMDFEKQCTNLKIVRQRD